MSYSCTNIDVAELRLSMTLDNSSDLHKSVIGAYRCEAGNESNVASCNIRLIPSFTPISTDHSVKFQV